MTEWSEWSECVVEANCPAKPEDSYPAPPKDHQLNEARRALHMAQKDMAFSRITACKETGTCPDIQVPTEKSTPSTCSGGTATTPVGNMPCSNINFAAFVSSSGLGTSSNANSNDIWGWTDSSDGNEYTIIGLTTGTSFVRTTDPQNPEVLCFLPTQTSSSSWRDMKVVNNFAYIVSEASNHGMQVFDLSTLKSMSGGGSVPTCTQHSHYSMITSSHNIASNPETGYLYIVGARGSQACSGGLHMINVNNPGSPQFAGCFSSDGYTHDVECVVYQGSHAAYRGREICFAYNENSLTIVDVQDKSNPVQLSRSTYSGSQYTHQGWNLESHNALLLDDELDEDRASTGNKNTRTYFWDISSLTSPSLKSTYYSTQQSIDHNQYIVRSLSYQSNYEAGLRIMTIDENNYGLSEAAYFQVKTGTPTANFAGTWSNYPYFIRSGELYPSYVPVSSIESGLFLLEPVYTYVADATEPEGEQSRGREAISGRGKCPAMTEKRTCQAQPKCF